MQSSPCIIQGSAGKLVSLIAGLVLFLSMASPSPAASSLPELTIPEGFGVNIHFTGDPQGTLVDMLGQSTHFSWQTDQLKLAVSGSPQYLLLAD